MSETNHQDTFKLLLLGDWGVGKTFLLSTARKPVHIDSFDPGGTKCLREWIEKGEVVVDTTYELEDPFHPSMFDKWVATMRGRIEKGYFKRFATYALDSSTTMGEALMNKILAGNSRAGQPPKWEKEYAPQAAYMQYYIRLLMNLPCDVVVTGHLEEKFKTIVKNGVPELFPDGYQLMATGKGKVKIPLLFDEIYHMEVVDRGSKGMCYELITNRTGTHVARSRIGGKNKLDIREQADLKHILKKAGFSTEDKKETK